MNNVKRPKVEDGLSYQERLCLKYKGVSKEKLEKMGFSKYCIDKVKELVKPPRSKSKTINQ